MASHGRMSWRESAQPWNYRGQQTSQLPNHRRRNEAAQMDRSRYPRTAQTKTYEPRGRVPGADESQWGDKPAYLRPQAADVVAAVESLYADMLKPFGRILLKRVRELEATRQTAEARTADSGAAEVDVDSVPLIDPKCLRKVCESCTNLCVEPEDGKEYSVLLVGQTKQFVDVCSPDDNYPAEMWAEASAYFESLQGEEMLLPGGRYACAQVLLSRGVAWLEGRSLGEVCHIVQLAVSQKRILGYLDGNMVPFGRSVDWIKEQCALYEQPVTFSKKATPDMPLATWEQARACLWDILESASLHGQPGVITLSNVKRLFRSRFNLELSETALGHSRLNELLQDARFSDICSLELQGKSQVVVQVPSGLMEDPYAFSAEYLQAVTDASTWDSNESFLESTPPRGLDPHAAPWTPGKTVDDYVCLSTLPVAGSDAPAPTNEDTQEETASHEFTNVLAGYVQQLLELGETQKGDVLEALNACSWKATGDADSAAAAETSGIATSAASRARKAGEHSRRSSLSASRSTSDEGSNPDLEHDEDSDADGANSAASSRKAGKGLSAEAAEFVMPTCSTIPLPPGLSPPPGLSF